MKKIEHMSVGFGSGKWFWLRIIRHVAVAGERHSNSSCSTHLQKRKECNKYDITTTECVCVSDWPPS
jgi:hypothetical protein